MRQAPGDSETLKYYYDGQEVIAEYDPSNALSRRYVHGTRRVDERAILLEGEGDDLDTYYYLLQDLQSVAGLLRKNGALVEGNRYEAYGEVEVFINDRALAPNKPETYAASMPEIEAFVADALGGQAFALEHQSDPRRRFGIPITVSRPASG